MKRVYETLNYNHTIAIRLNYDKYELVKKNHLSTTIID